MREYYKQTLPNGLQVITVEIPHLHSAEMACYVGTGARHESEELSGISHFLEHMLFRGTQEYASSLELEKAFEEIGGAVNASTDAEVTCYHSRFHPDHVNKAAGLFSSMLRRPLFSEIETERRIILEEAMEDLNEQGEEINLDNLTARMLWAGHPLGQPTIGTLDSIKSITLEDLKGYHQSYYSPSNTLVVVAGRVCHEDVQAAVEAHFGSWEGQKTTAPRRFDPSAAIETPQTAWIHDSDSQVSVQLAFQVPGRRHASAVPLRALRRVLSWGGTSRLMLHLRERLGLTYNVDASLSLFDEVGCLSIDLMVAPANLVTAVKETLRVLEELCREPVASDELQRVIRNALFDLEFSQDQTEEMSIRYGWGELMGCLRTLEADRRDLSAVTPHTLWEVARRSLRGEALKVACVGPFKAADRKAVEAVLAGFRDSDSKQKADKNAIS